MATGSELLKMPSGGMRARQELMASEIGPAADSTSQALVAQARAVQAVVAALNLKIKIEGSDSLDHPDQVATKK